MNFSELLIEATDKAYEGLRSFEGMEHFIQVLYDLKAGGSPEQAWELIREEMESLESEDSKLHKAVGSDAAKANYEAFFAHKPRHEAAITVDLCVRAVEAWNAGRKKRVEEIFSTLLGRKVAIDGSPSIAETAIGAPGWILEKP